MNELGNGPWDKNYKPSGINRAESRALEFYPMKDYNKEPNYIHSCDSKMLDEVYRQVFMLGYEQAEKDTIESVCKWLEEHFVDMSHYSDRGSFGRIETTDFDSMEEMVNDLKKALEEQK